MFFNFTHEKPLYLLCRHYHHRLFGKEMRYIKRHAPHQYFVPRGGHIDAERDRLGSHCEGGLGSK